MPTSDPVEAALTRLRLHYAGRSATDDEIPEAVADLGILLSDYDQRGREIDRLTLRSEVFGRQRGRDVALLADALGVTADGYDLECLAEVAVGLRCERDALRRQQDKETTDA